MSVWHSLHPRWRGHMSHHFIKLQPHVPVRCKGPPVEKKKKILIQNLFHKDWGRTFFLDVSCSCFLLLRGVLASHSCPPSVSKLAWLSAGFILRSFNCIFLISINLHHAKLQFYLFFFFPLGLFLVCWAFFLPLLLLFPFQNAAHCKWKSIVPRVMSWYKSAEHIIPGTFRFITPMCSSSARRGVMSRVAPCGAVIFWKSVMWVSALQDGREGRNFWAAFYRVQTTAAVSYQDPEKKSKCFLTNILTAKMTQFW